MRSRFVIALGSVVALLSFHAGCARTDPAPGELMLAVQTDMHAPKDVDAVGIYVAERDLATSHDTLIFGFAERVAPDGTVHFPATLAVVGKKNPGATVRVRAVAFRGNQARIVRDAITTIPTDRSALLRLPLRWIDDNGKTSGTFSSDGSVGSASLADLHQLAGGDTSLLDGFIQITSGCKDDETPLNGGCAPATIDSSTLPDYNEADVFGGGSPDGGGACFDVAKCFGGKNLLALDLATCSAPAPQGVFDLAIATKLGDKGDCEGDACYVPLDKDTPEGWTLQNGRVVIPGAYCARIQAGDAIGIATDGNVPGCAPKENDAPLCGPASAVGPGTGNDDAGLDDGGLDGPSDGSISDVADAGPPVIPLASGLDAPTAIAVDGTDVYVTVRSGAVYKLSTSPGQAAPFFDPLGLPDGGRATAGAAPEVHVSARGGNVVVAVTRVVPTNGPRVFLLHSDGGVVLQVGTDGGAIEDVLATPTAAVWTFSSGYPATVVQTGPWDGGAATTWAINGLDYVPRAQNIAYDETSAAGPSAYFVSEPTGSSNASIFKSVPIGADPGPAYIAGSAGPPLGGIALDKGNVYVSLGAPDGEGGISPTTGSIHLYDRTSGSVHLKVTDDNTLPLLGTDVSTYPHSLAVDGTGLFWTNAKGEVWSFPTQGTNPDGGLPPKKLVANGQQGPRGVAVAGDFVYWTATAGGTVMRASRSALGIP